MVAERADLVAIVAAVAYAYDNLLAHSGSSSDSGPTPEQLLQYFTWYISWTLDVFRSNDEFLKLLASNSDFAEALVVSCNPALTPPWVLDRIAGARATSTRSEKITFATPNNNHILYRKCTCSYTGVMGIQCSSCKKFENEIGTNVEFYGSLLGTVGEGRISGTKTNFQYKCKWCQTTKTYDTSSAKFNRPGYGSSYYQSCIGSLWCPKCHLQGHDGNISYV